MTTLYPYQKQGARNIHRWGGRALLADDMGLGKTIQSLYWLKKNPSKRPCIIVCPASVKWNWQREAAEHFGMYSEVLSGTKPSQEGLGNIAPLLILNYDILPKWTPYLLQIDPQVLILDEIHYLKTRTTQRTKAARKLAQRIPHVIGLSGTPMTNRPAELWSPLNIIRPDLYPAFFPFAQRYCDAKKGFWGWDFTGQSNLDELNKNLRKSVMIRRTKAEVLTQLPPKTRTPIQIDLENRREYQLAHNNFLQWLAKVRPEKIKGAVRSQALVKLGYLKRLAARLKLKNALQWVDEFLETTNQKIVIFAIHKEPIEIITKRYEHTQVTVDGSVIGKKRQWAVDKFQKNKDCRVFIGNIHAAGIGITLTAASTVAFFELDWTPGNHTQAEDRCHRIGTTQPVNCYYLTAKDTIEDNLLKLIRKKQKIITTAIDGKPTDEFDILTELLNL